MKQEEGDGGKEVRSTDIGDLAKEIKTLLAKDFPSAEKSSEIVAILKSGLVKCGKDCISNLISNGIFLELVRQDLDEVLDLLLQNDILDGSVVNQVDNQGLTPLRLRGPKSKLESS